MRWRFGQRSEERQVFGKTRNRSRLFALLEYRKNLFRSENRGRWQSGLPTPAVLRAEQVLAILEQGEQSGAIARLAEDLPLFAALAETPTQVASELLNVEAELLDLNPDDLTPRAALEAIYRLRALLEN